MLKYLPYNCFSICIMAFKFNPVNSGYCAVVIAAPIGTGAVIFF